MSKLAWLLGTVVTFASGCFAHIPNHSQKHLEIQWRADYERAREDAAFLRKPVLVVMTAGEKEGKTCLGADLLRSSALADDTVIATINREFVPVWVNIRTTPVPSFPFVERVLVTARVDAQNRVTDLFSRNYFFRSVIVSPDGQTLLNPGGETVAQTAKKIVLEGDLSYEVVDSADYLTMLNHALDRYRWRAQN